VNTGRSCVQFLNIESTACFPFFPFQKFSSELFRHEQSNVVAFQASFD